MKQLLIFLFVCSSLIGVAQNSEKLKSVSWNGYTQFRFTSNFYDVNSFGLRRMKLWISSTPDFDKHWGLRLQTTISSTQNEKFFLQDAEAFYRNGNFRVNFGQFVPQYSLQRFQSDATLPLAERSPVINALVPNGNLGVRDLGVEVNYTGPDKIMEAWFGIFNGNGIKNYALNNKGIMLTQKTAVHLFHNHIVSGYSVMYRKADQLQLTSILPSSFLFSGNDFRTNLFTQYQSQKLQVQAEYLWARLNGEIADGYYILATLNLKKNQVVASWNQYNDLIESTDNAPTAHLGYDYLFNKEELKILLDNGVQIKDRSLKDYTAVLQLQLFFN